ncbi:putative ABC transport system permease protein [Salinibacillus kushneri]|uniref:Putative ABC transport system permease protein n=1 Tax=Salinibacillus kushneri TaxID=237682 RepID=A0A1I0B087_9BACI|nr:ABC transporter permease [Salinibacillus kushneri]SET00145.1 putative ABC transport system permease protein [Salinibacillus kushneri]
MIDALYGALESGLIYALMALGVYLTFRVLDFPDLTVDGSFVTGGAVSAILIVNGANPFLATMLGGVAGFLAGCVTGLLHTKGNINPLLSGILMMTGLYSVNLRIMGQANIPLLNESTIFSIIGSWWESINADAILLKPFTAIGIENYAPDGFLVIISMLIVVIFIKLITDWLLQTEAGLALRATGDNIRMARSLSANTNRYIVMGLGLSNGLVGLSGALIVQYNGFSDVNLGVGMIVVGLASVIIGEGLFGTKKIVRTTLAVMLGAIVYRMIIALALRVDFVDASDMKLITSLIVIGALVIPYWWKQIKENKKRHSKRKRLNENLGANEHASTKSD